MGHAHKRVVNDEMISAAVVTAGLVTAQSPTGTGTNVSTCDNPVLNKTLVEWGSPRGASVVREAVGGGGRHD